MRRSPVLAGLTSQRDRAQLRGRLDRRERQTAPSPKDQLVAWLNATVSIHDVSEAETLDLTDFLRNSGKFELSPEERLRQLAIFLEPDLLTPQPRGWLALDRIYQQALRYAPNSVWVHHSRALSGKYCAECLSPNDDATTYRRIMESAWDAANRAHQIESTDADVLYLLGSLSYIDSTRTVKESLMFFDEAIGDDPNHQWALLYRAHCLQDLERWAAAAAAYDVVNPSYFVGPWVWRYELLLEQRAYCLLRSGDDEAALAQFRRLLDRWTANPELANGPMGVYITDAASGQLRRHLWDDLFGLVRRENLDWFPSAEPESGSSRTMP